MSIRLLDAVSRLGSISGASIAVGISQQAASARMRRLEARIGRPLFLRHAHGTALTPDGSVVAEWAADVVAATERFDAGVASLRGRAEPTRVAASMTVAEYLLPRWLMAARDAREPVAPDVTITATNSASVIDLVASGSHPLGFIESPQDAAGLTAVSVARDELVVVVAPAHPWGARKAVSLARLAATPLITREKGSGTRLNAERLMSEAGHPPTAPLLELPTTASIRTAVASGAGAAILSILAVRDDLDAGRLVTVRVRDTRFIRELRAVFAAEELLPRELWGLLAVARRSA